MKVILTTKVKKLGEIGDVAVVKDGYAKNYLIAKKIAIPYSEEVFKEFAISAMTAGERIVFRVTVEEESAPVERTLSLTLAMLELRFLAAASE